MRWRARWLVVAVPGFVACGGDGDAAAGDAFRVGAATMAPALGPDGIAAGVVRQALQDSAGWINTITLATVEGVFVGTATYGGALLGTPPAFDGEGFLGTAHDGQLHLLSPWGATWATWDTGGNVGAAVDVDGTWMVPADDRLRAVTSDGVLVFEAAVGGPIGLPPAIGADGSVAVVTQPADAPPSLVIVEPDGAVRGSTALPGLARWIGRSGSLVVAIGDAPSTEAPPGAWVVGIDADGVTSRWTADLEGVATGFAQDTDGDVIVASYLSDTAGRLVRLAASDGATDASEDLDAPPGPPSLDDQGRVWASCPGGICTYSPALAPRGVEIDLGVVPSNPVPVSIRDGWVALVADNTLSAWRMPGVDAPDGGWSRLGGGPANAGRELE